MGEMMYELTPELLEEAAIGLISAALDGHPGIYRIIDAWMVTGQHDPRAYSPAESAVIVIALWQLVLDTRDEAARSRFVELARIHWRRLHERICVICGCSDSLACEGGCHWVTEDRCSTCIALAAELLRRGVA